MNKLFFAVIGTTLMVSLPVLAEAGNRDPGVNQRQHNQQHRIKQGVRSGELTREEARTLAREQRTIRQEERQYKADGVLTRDERKDLHRDLNQASRSIYNEKHDDDKRSGGN